MTNPSARPTGDNTPNGSNSPLPGITRERVTFENSIVGAVETVLGDDDEDCNIPENRAAVATAGTTTLVDDGSMGMPSLDESACL